MKLKDIVMEKVGGKPRLYFKFSNNKFAAVEFPKDATTTQVKKCLISLVDFIQNMTVEEAQAENPLPTKDNVVIVWYPRIQNMNLVCEKGNGDVICEPLVEVTIENGFLILHTRDGGRYTAAFENSHDGYIFRNGLRTLGFSF